MTNSIRTPNRLKDVRRFLDLLDLGKIEADIAAEARAQLIIVGPVNSGKSTLFNQLKGQKLSTVSAVPGTTTEILSERFGPFWLLDTPGLGEVKGSLHTGKTLGALDQADLAVLVLDAGAGVRQDDADLYAQIRALGLPVVVALNKMDLIPNKDEKRVIHDVERKMGVPVIPISAKKGTNVGKKLIPALIDAHPKMAVTIGRALPKYRRRAAQRIIRESTIIAGVTAAEPVPGLAIPIIIAVQVRLLLRLAAIFGETMSAARARELLTAIAGGIGIRYATQELVKFVPVAGSITAAIVAATGTTALGNVAMLFFENEQNLRPSKLRELYRQARKKRSKAGEIPEIDD